MSDTHMTAQDFLAVRARLAAELKANAGRSQVNTTALAEGLLTSGYADVDAILRELYPERYRATDLDVARVPLDVVAEQIARRKAERDPARHEQPALEGSFEGSPGNEAKPLGLPDVEALAEDAAAGDAPPNRGCPNAYRAAPGEVVQCTRPFRYLGGVREHQNHRDGDPTTYSTATVKWREGDPNALVWRRGHGWVSPADVYALGERAEEDPAADGDGYDTDDVRTI